MSYFNVRVYGILINENQEVLLSDEREYGMDFTKFPGGGLELGEGLINGLKREFMEECGLEIEVIRHFYTTDFFEKSSFNDSQVISIYYLVKPLAPLNFPLKQQVFDFEPDLCQAFRWVSISNLQTTDVTFKTDKVVVDLIKSTYSA